MEENWRAQLQLSQTEAALESVLSMVPRVLTCRGSEVLNTQFGTGRRKTCNSIYELNWLKKLTCHDYRTN